MRRMRAMTDRVAREGRLGGLCHDVLPMFGDLT